ncbi:MAG: aquaporin [Candidatus Pacebacteria bacterium]|nr:aquaporin [Candidatus Paceibacterota bacterium]
MKKYIAEFIGTAVLTLAVVGSIINGSGFVTLLTVGITLGLFVATIGSISGSHINPAVTLGLLSIKKIHWKEAVFYIIAQFAGAALALILVRLHSAEMPALDYAFSWTSLVAEFVGAIIFTFGIASIVLAHDSHKAESKAPFVIGGSLTLGATLASALGSNAVINPAVAFGIGSFGLAYIIGPILGGIAGVWLFKTLK